MWDQRGRAEDGRPTELVLTPATALVPPDKFPPPPSSWSYFLRVNVPAPNKAWASVAPRTRKAYS